MLFLPQLFRFAITLWQCERGTVIVSECETLLGACATPGGAELQLPISEQPGPSPCTGNMKI